ncbi:unnamed protein product [Cylicostephanus goldi]|uniref:Uncharacterized protein n=1 Tax=Cylicostephanus goldi TaxID=71465 RepID=A0A3P7MZ14_CYLGO|nr:unnamed protein product [Cylicostephanus goldi]
MLEGKIPSKLVEVVAQIISTELGAVPSLDGHVDGRQVDNVRVF